MKTINVTNGQLEDLSKLGFCFETKPEYTYPIFKRIKTSGAIVKFTDLQTGEVVWKGNYIRDIGYTDITWNPHTDKGTWADVAYDAERDLWDTQPVYAWDRAATHFIAIAFYDAINKTVFSFDGARNGLSYINYEAIKPEHYPERLLEAHKTLKI
jgi:hypothetical protein